jgi:hypothetical protein
MRNISLPNWLLWVDKNLNWLSIPKLPLILTIIQAFGFILAKVKPDFTFNLTLVPSAILQGEVWRIFTFIATPFARTTPFIPNLLLVLVVLWFLYYIMTELENVWGATLFTAYFLIAWFCSVLAALLIGTTIEWTIVYMEVSFFFALATLNPNNIIYLFFILPIAYKWIAVFIAIVLFVVPLFLGDFLQQLYVMLLFANYMIFFGKDYWLRFKRELDKRKKAQ